MSAACEGIKYWMLIFQIAIESSPKSNDCSTYDAKLFDIGTGINEIRRMLIG